MYLDATALSTFLTDIGSVITFLFGQFVNVFQMVMNNPPLLITFAVFIAGAILGLARRAIGVAH